MLGKRVDKLGKDLVGHNSLGELIRVVGQTTEGQSSGLLDRWHVIEKEWTEKSHNACKSHETVSEKVQRRKPEKKRPERKVRRTKSPEKEVNAATFGAF